MHQREPIVVHGHVYLVTALILLLMIIGLSTISDFQELSFWKPV